MRMYPDAPKCMKMDIELRNRLEKPRMNSMKEGMQKVRRFVGVYIYSGEKGKCYYITYTVRGKTRWEKVGWDYEGYNATFAKHIRGERVRELHHGKYIPKDSKNHLTMDEAFNKYIEWAKANNKKSIQGDKSRYNNHLKPHMEHRLLPAWVKHIWPVP